MHQSRPPRASRLAIYSKEAGQVADISGISSQAACSPSKISTTFSMRIKNWGIFAFIAGYHALLLALLPALIKIFTWEVAAMIVVGWAVGCLSITVGYHRLFSHRTYKAHPLFEWACLLGSSLAVEASALRWSNDHRIHHSHVDTDKDPYCIKKGFWYAHILWMFQYRKDINERLVSDLLKNPRVAFQDRHYGLFTIAVNLAFFGIGCLFMEPFAAFAGGCLLRLFVIHHCTWFINSLAHVWGARTYAKEQTAADNAFMALLTFGEGYHNYHHAIATDYRNGVRWYHFDPSKWIIWMASKLGWTKDLKWVSDVKVRQSLVSKDKRMILECLRNEIDETASEFRQKMEDLAEAYHSKATLLNKKLRQMREESEEQRQHLLKEVRELKKELRYLWKSWVALTSEMTRQYRVGHA